MTILECFKGIKSRRLRRKLFKYQAPYWATSKSHTDSSALHSAFVWSDTTEGHNYWSNLYNLFVEGDTFDTVWRRFNIDGLSIPSYLLKRRVKGLEAAIYKAIQEKSVEGLAEALVDKTWIKQK
jgi:hypothetical protein